MGDELKVGDIVRWQAGGGRMTIAASAGHGSWSCVWRDKTKDPPEKMEAIYPGNTLRKIEPKRLPGTRPEDSQDRRRGAPFSETDAKWTQPSPRDPSLDPEE